ncbi:hypothetical protein MP619_08305 [Streptococcus dysgalactiae]|uniref:Uncharacterized protein n=1 Tax=Streptococcus dysgalactiae TaxID=1334 RepID=A0AAF0A0P7_STRDY|nr:hypothetical protein [Streptococcus dysgalactiae]QGH03358.1 hypothetical protein EA458_01815 [Streptococcus dysgalactiae subsp. dysgalactiae]WAI92498.1 hypothetical protein MP619_08305 [Streptococcus dysgalactiae]WCE86971.1 hypothetical protein PMN45_05140 [Streptococcus dysgalactiae]WCN26968.1 hypothetical protein PP188_05150 [Streptococcus dysgalactiae]
MTAKMIASLLLGLVLFMAFFLSNLVLNIVFTSLFFWTIVDVNHLLFNKLELVLNDYSWKKEELFERHFLKILKKRLQKSELSYSNLMSILLYDAINQCSFFTDSDIFEDILKAIIDSEDIILCTGLVELLRLSQVFRVTNVEF